MDVLIVGAGALGQPFGYHLHEGGADVAYAVKPEHVESCADGFTLHRYQMFGGPEELTFDDYELFADYDELESDGWDQVWLCVSTPAIHGDWLPELLEAVGETTLVSIQPGLEAREYLEEQYPPERIVSVRVSMIAWQTPLPGEELPEGDIAYFLPPATPIYVGEGDASRAEAVATSLDEGGCPASVHDDVLAEGAFGAAMLEPSVAAIETAGWSLADFRRGEASGLAGAACREALEVVGREYGDDPPWMLRFATRPWVMRVGTWFASAALPFDLEAYLEEHFTKVGDQTREDLANYIESGEEQGVEVDGMRRLMEALPP